MSTQGTVQLTQVSPKMTQPWMTSQMMKPCFFVFFYIVYLSCLLKAIACFTHKQPYEDFFPSLVKFYKFYIANFE